MCEGGIQHPLIRGCVNHSLNRKINLCTALTIDAAMSEKSITDTT